MHLFVKPAEGGNVYELTAGVGLTALGVYACSLAAVLDATTLVGVHADGLATSLGAWTGCNVAACWVTSDKNAATFDGVEAGADSECDWETHMASGGGAAASGKGAMV